MFQRSIQTKSFRDSKSICKHINFTPVFFVGKYRLNKCRSCNIIFSNKWTSLDSRSAYIDYYRNETPMRFRFGIEVVIKAFRLFRAFKIYTISPHAKSILDIGSGRGYTLYFLKKYFRYKRVVGTQIEKNAYLYSKNILGLEIHDKDLLDINLKKNEFDFVTLWHVLEHVKKPEQYIIKIKSALKDGGQLIIEVPNFNSWTRKFCHKYWLGLDLKYHLFFFDKETLTSLLEKHGFSIQRVHTFSLEYSTFTSAQSIVSWLTRSNNIFFNYLQTGKSKNNILLHVFLIILISPIALVVNLLLYRSNLGEDMLIVARNQKSKNR